MPSESLAERLTGVYITSISEIDEWAISIRSIGDLLLIENSLCSDGIVYAFWAQELVPGDASVLDESSSDSIRGICYEFSFMSEYDGYWDDTADMTVALTEDGVCLTKNFDDYGLYDIEEKNSFVRTEDKGYFHTDTKNLYEMLSQMHALTADTEPVGKWSLIGLNFNAWISLCQTEALIMYSRRNQYLSLFFPVHGRWTQTVIYRFLLKGLATQRCLLNILSVVSPSKMSC